MFTINKNYIHTKPSDVLEKFRIKAHLRSYLKDPISIDGTLLSEAALLLKKLPYNDYDPAESIVTEMVLEAYRSGHIKQRNLTDAGYKLIRHSKFRGHNQLFSMRTFSDQILRNC